MINRQQKLTIIAVALCLMAALGGAPLEAQTPDSRPLTTGQSIEREIKGDEAHSYNLVLAAGQYLNVVVEQKGVDVVVALFDANNNKLTEVDSPNGTQGSEPIVLITEIAGNYRLEVRSLEKSAPAGRYEAKIVELRMAMEKDKSRIAALKIFAEAEVLHLQGVVQSLRGAIKKYEESLSLFRVIEDRQMVAQILYRIGNIYNELGENQQALKFFNESLPMFRAGGDKIGSTLR